MKLKIFAPARLQSERLPNKLILPIGESSLFREACKKLAIINNRYESYVLCNDQQLIDIAEDEGVNIIKRDPVTGTVDGPLNYIFKDIEQIDATHMMFLNPCLFYLRVETILGALETFEKENMNYATSVKPLKNWLFDEYGNHLNDMNYKNLNTKEIDPVYQAAHCFHIFNKNEFFRDGQMLKSGMGILPITNEEELIDVDTIDDYDYLIWKELKCYV